MYILFITSNYPTTSRPYCGAFVRNFIRAIARTGVRCTVVNPISIFDRRYGKFDSHISWDTYIPDNPIEVRQPRYISLSNKNLTLINTLSITHNNFHNAVQRVINEMNCVPEIIYGHFIYPSGAVAANIGSAHNITSIVAVGEDTEEDFIFRDKLLQKKWDIRQIDGVIAVSNVNKNRCIDELKIPSEKIKVLPNAIDSSLFYQRDKIKMREKYGLPQQKTIIAFTGHFNYRKGYERVVESIKGLNNIGAVFIGAGSAKVKNNNNLFMGMLEHEKVPEMLSAADMFVLPTLSEGSCNAILEALACGLPVITSASDFNDEIIDHNVAIKVDPLNINEIRQAIIMLHSNIKLRNTMSLHALYKSMSFNVDVRAKTALQWMQEMKCLVSHM